MYDRKLHTHTHTLASHVHVHIHTGAHLPTPVFWGLGGM